MEKKTFKEKESPEDRVKRLRIRDWNDDAFLVAEHLRQPSVKPRDLMFGLKLQRSVSCGRNLEEFLLPITIGLSRLKS